MDMFTVMYPQLQEIDFQRDVKRLAVPVYVLDGTAELAARRDLTLEWFNGLDAPTKRQASVATIALAGGGSATRRVVARRATSCCPYAV